MKPMTIAQSILVSVARSCNFDPEARLTKEDLVMVAWRSDRQRLGLRGYEQLAPDSNRIVVELSKNGTGLVSLGWLERVAPSTYRVTAKGLEVARAAAGVAPPAFQYKAPGDDAPAAVRAAWYVATLGPLGSHELGHLLGLTYFELGSRVGRSGAVALVDGLWRLTDEGRALLGPRQESAVA